MQETKSTFESWRESVPYQNVDQEEYEYIDEEIIILDEEDVPLKK
jgi:hypothetical protein